MSALHVTSTAPCRLQSSSVEKVRRGSRDGPGDDLAPGDHDNIGSELVKPVFNVPGHGFGDRQQGDDGGNAYKETQDKKDHLAFAAL